MPYSSLAVYRPWPGPPNSGRNGDVGEFVTVGDCDVVGYDVGSLDAEGELLVEGDDDGESLGRCIQ